MPDDDPMDVEGCLRLLNEALPMQHRSAIECSMAAGSLAGLEFVGLSDRLWQYAQAELADSRRLVEKIRALGGQPATSVATLSSSADAQEAAAALVDHEREVIAKLHEVISHTGQEPRSEALEHLIEHLIMRKQEQLDQLLRALGRTE